MLETPRRSKAPGTSDATSHPGKRSEPDASSNQTDGCLLTIRSIQRNLNDRKNGRRGLLALTIVHAVEFSRIGRTSPTDLPTSGLRLPVPSTNRHLDSRRPAGPGATPWAVARSSWLPTYIIPGAFPTAFGARPS